MRLRVDLGCWFASLSLEVPRFTGFMQVWFSVFVVGFTVLLEVVLCSWFVGFVRKFCRFFVIGFAAYSSCRCLAL